MGWEEFEMAPSSPPLPQDRFRLRREEMLNRVFVIAVELLKRLPPVEAQGFAIAAHDSLLQLVAKQEAQTARREQHPLRLPSLQAPNTNLRFLQGRRRAITGREAAEAAEQDTISAQRRAEGQAAAREEMERLEREGRERERTGERR